MSGSDHIQDVKPSSTIPAKHELDEADRLEIENVRLEVDKQVLIIFRK